MSTPLKSGYKSKLSTLQRVADRSLVWPFKVWGFGEGIALRGLRAVHSVTNHSKYHGFVSAMLRSYVVRGVAQGNEEHIAPGTELLQLYEEGGEPELLEAARRLAALNASFPLNTFGARMHRPDLPGWRKQIWVDSMDVDAPFLLKLGSITNDESYVDQGLNELLGYARALQVESNNETDGLFWHGYEEDCGTNGKLWARGNGWAVMGLVETLKLLSDSHPARKELRERLDRLIHALKRHQDKSGLWHTVVTHPETYLESTLAVMTAFALHEAFTAGLTDPKAFGKMERDARFAAIRCIKEDGGLDLVSDATPIGELKMYATRPFDVFPWGQGPVMLMLAQDTL